MIHIVIERLDLATAVAEARNIYSIAVSTGRHVLLDAPGDIRTNLPERRLSAAQILISARVAPQPN